MRSKIYVLFFLLCIGFNSSAQFTLRIEITTAPPAHSGEPVYIAGNFNQWKPGDNKFLLTKESDKIFLEIKALSPGPYQFKFTRGNWEKVESTEKGVGIGNREINLTADTTISCSIAGWADDFVVPQKNTASSNVHIMDTAFFIPQLNRTRRIWIYLPQGYSKTKKHYPVMYLQDGQNLFDERTTAFGSEWGVDECLDSLIAKGKPACIVVGIDHGGDKRMNEYSPYEFSLKDLGGSNTFSPEGNEYLVFLTQTLKPFIDKKYRTLSSKENTIIAGSSMGGLISYYAAIKYPGIFGKAGVFSPSFWIAPQVKDLTDSVSKKIDSKFFFYIGELEGETNVDNMNEIAQKLGANSNAMIYSVIDTEGKHNETAWRKWFAEFYAWMMADGYNNVIKLEKE